MLPVYAFQRTAAVGGAAPTVSAIAPNVFDTAGGGGVVTITGTAFTAATGVTIGGTAATSVTVVSSTSITCIPGARTAGSGLSVVVTTPSGSNGANALAEYWTPSQISGVDAYFDAGKGTTGTAPITAWVEQSRAASYTPAGTGPTLVASVFGTLPAARFVPSRSVDGARRALASGASVFWVGKWTSTDTTRSFAGNAPLTIVGDTSGSVLTGWGANAGQLENNHYNGVQTPTNRGASLNDGVARLMGWTHSTADVLTAYVSTTQQGATASVAYATIGPSAWTSVGLGFGPGDGWDGDVGAVVIINGVISGADLTRLNSWAQQRFGTP
jgi:hypothetical protein